MITIYKNGKAVKCDPEQLDLMLAAGWSKTEKPVAEKAEKK